MDSTESYETDDTGHATNGGNTEMISENVLHIFTLVIFVAFYTLISLSGIIANIINIFVYSKMDLSDTVNLSFLALAISDFGFLFMTLLLSICYYPFWKTMNLNFEILDLKYLVVGWPQYYFRLVSSGITASVTCERCLCIALPLKVSEIVTPRRVLCVIASIFILMAVAVSPVYFSVSYQYVFDPLTNRTYLLVVSSDNRDELDSAGSAICFTLTVGILFLVMLLTSVLVVNLKRSAQWRAGVAKEGAVEQKVQPAVGTGEAKGNKGRRSASSAGSRDRRIIKVVTTLSVIFCVSSLPDAGVLIIMTFEPNMISGGRLANLLLVLLGVSETLLALNASVNIAVYLKMSSKYRKAFQQYCLKKKK